jgi:hypothetical protein
VKTLLQHDSVKIYHHQGVHLAPAHCTAAAQDAARLDSTSTYAWIYEYKATTRRALSSATTIMILLCTDFICCIRTVFDYTLSLILWVQNARTRMHMRVHTHTHTHTQTNTHTYMQLWIRKHFKCLLQLVLTLTHCTPWWWYNFTETNCIDYLSVFNVVHLSI